jgi:hypothetical protein
MQWNQVRLAELALPDGEDAAGLIDVAQHEVARLGEPKAARGQQRKQGCFRSTRTELTVLGR